MSKYIKIGITQSQVWNLPTHILFQPIFHIAIERYQEDCDDPLFNLLVEINNLSDENLIKEIINCQDLNGNTPLHSAFARQSYQLIELIYCYISPRLDLKNSEGLTPRELAYSLPLDSIIELLE